MAYSVGHVGCVELLLHGGCGGRDMGWRGKVIVRRGMIEWRGVFRWLCVFGCVGGGVE